MYRNTYVKITCRLEETVVKKSIFDYAILCSNCTQGYDIELLKNNLLAFNRNDKQFFFSMKNNI